MPGSNATKQVTDTRRYTFAPAMGPPHVYELDADGLTYHLPGEEAVVLRWGDIQYLDERPGQKVDIVAGTVDKPVPLYFATQDFADLLERLCTELAMLHREKMETSTFRATRSYFTHFSVVIGVLIAFVMAGVLFLNFFEPTMFLVVAMTVPVGVSLVLQPIEVTPTDEGLRVRDFLRLRLVPYGAIAALVFDVRGDLNYSFLRLVITLKSGRLYIPPGEHCCLYALQAALPLLGAKQRTLEDGDWLKEDNRVLCPDPAGNVILRIERME